MDVLRDERGQVLIVAALCLTCLLGFVGFAVDVGLLLREKRIMQTAADSGAVAGAAEMYYGDVTAAARADTSQNGFTNGTNGTTVTVNNPPANGPNSGNNQYVEVIVSQSQPTFFMKMFSLSSMMVSARAVATVIPAKDCIVTTETSPSPPGSPGAGIAASGSATLSVPSCGIIENGDETGHDAVNLTGAASISALFLSTAGTVSTGVQSKITVTNPNTVTTGITAVADPLASIVTAPSNPGGCTALNINSTTTIGPASGGTICYSSLTISGGTTTVTLNPGVYYINGNLKIQGSASVLGTGGVTFYITNNGQVTVSGGSSLNLTAPTSGTYSGILFYQDPADTQTFTFSGGSSGTINGIFYLPDTGLSLSGGSGSTFNVDLVVGWINLTGNASINPYAALKIPSPLSPPVLAE